jgi:hypothetical protein
MSGNCQLEGSKLAYYLYSDAAPAEPILQKGFRFSYRTTCGRIDGQGTLQLREAGQSSLIWTLIIRIGALP